MLLNTAAPNETDGPDSYTWFVAGSTSNVFSTKQTWENLRPRETAKQWAAAVWYKGCIPKHAFTFWVAHLNRLPIRARTTNWGINRPSLCCICQAETETREHLFLHCRFSYLLCKQVLARFGKTSVFREWQELIDWMLSGSARVSTILIRLTVQATIFHIWKERNSRLHTSTSSNHSAVFKHIDRSVRDAILARNDRKSFKDLLAQWFALE